jgi:hypothetical protein
MSHFKILFFSNTRQIEQLRMSVWGSPFKLDQLVGAVSKTIQNVERSIDRAIGIPEEENNVDNSNSPRTTPSLEPTKNANPEEASQPKEIESSPPTTPKQNEEKKAPQTNSETQIEVVDIEPKITENSAPVENKALDSPPQISEITDLSNETEPLQILENEEDKNTTSNEENTITSPVSTQQEEQTEIIQEETNDWGVEAIQVVEEEPLTDASISESEQKIEIPLESAPPIINPLQAKIEELSLILQEREKQLERFSLENALLHQENEQLKK